MKVILLTQGKVAVVDDDDYEAVVAAGPWHLGKGGKYAEGRLGVYMHRLVLGAVYGQQVDHANLNGLDNRRANLRLCTNSQNRANQVKQSGCSSRFKGDQAARTMFGSFARTNFQESA